MAENVSARMDKDHREALNQMVDANEADSPSEALRQASRAELARRGHLHGATNGADGLAWMAREIGKWFGIFGMAFLAFTVFWPVSVRMWVLFFAFASIGSYGMAGVLESGAAARLSARWGERA